MAPATLDPKPGRRAKFERRHPRLYASRHVAKGAGEVALAIVGLAFLVRFLPAIPWPDIDLPSIPLPSFDLPDIPLPSIEITVPDWIKAIAKSKKFWLPVIIGIVLASAELKRLKRRNVERDDRAGDAARPRTGTSE